MASEPPPPYEKETPNGEITFASQTERLEQLFHDPPRYPTITDNQKNSRYRNGVSCLMSLTAFTMYLLVVIGCSVNGLKGLYLVRFDNVGARFLVRDYAYAATVTARRMEVTSIPSTTRSSSFLERSSIEAFATTTQISASGNLVATTTHSSGTSTPTSVTSMGSATRTAFQSATATWKTYGRTTPITSARALATSYYTKPEALYLPTNLGNYTAFMGYYGTIKNAHYRYGWSLGIPSDYYVGIWSYGYFSTGYKTKRNTIYSGIDYSKMVNDNAVVWVYMPGLNYKEKTIGFLGRSKMNQTNNIAKALQPLSVILMVSLVLFVGMAFQIFPRKWTLYVAPLTVVYSLVFNILYNVVARRYGTYITTAFPMKEVTVDKGLKSVPILWIAFTFQCITCFIEWLLLLH